MATIELPSEIKGKFQTWFENIYQQPGSYFDTTKNKPIAPFDGEDPWDPNNPGVNEEFILNKDRTDVWYNGVSLETNAMNNLKTIVYPPSDMQIELLSFLEEHFGMTFRSVSGRFYYPDNGGFMGWHTNSDTPGKKIYLAYTPHEKESFFRYFDEESQQVVTDWDQQGINVRVFDIESKPGSYYWHCVYAYRPRISYGFYLA